MTGTDLRAMQSFGTPRPTSNPYIHMLDAALSATPGLVHLRFDWPQALTGRLDVIHFHWPETALEGRTRLRRTIRRSRFQVLLWSLRVRGVRIVRTVHNLELPSGLTAWERRMLDQVRRRSAANIVLNETTASGDRHVIPHGHYVDWYRDAPRGRRIDGRIGFVGLIRRYKGVEQLLAAYGDLRARRCDVSLALSGRPTTPSFEEEIAGSIAGLPDVEARFAYLSDDEYVAAVTAAELVVLPYVHMHNSGSALAALSLGRPVLVPDNEVNRALASEVGAEWVHLFAGTLSAEDLDAALRRVRTIDPGVLPDLSRRDWSGTGRLHLAAYRAALAR